MKSKSLIKIVVVLFLVCAALIVSAKSSRQGKGPYDLAKDLPRGPLVYVQFKDLPELLKKWDESELKKRYLLSTNYDQFQSRHLALKLVERWEEFNNGAGFQFDIDAFGDAAENRAAVAIYDIGKLDILFIAPVSEEKLAEAVFFKEKDRFEEIELPDGTVYYSQDIDADRGRQKQKIVFSLRKGRFVLATNEQLLLRALANINGKTKKDRLSDEPSFITLSNEVKPHEITIWVDQVKLNSDWYFKNYWAMSNVGELRDIKAGMFDLELKDEKFIERRDFLYSGKKTVSNLIQARDVHRIEELLPSEIPYWKIKSLNGDTGEIVALLQTTLFSKQEKVDAYYSQSKYWEMDRGFNSYDDDERWWGRRRYSYLDDSYDISIDDPGDEAIRKESNQDLRKIREDAKKSLAGELRQALQSAAPVYATMTESPRVVAGPLFAEFRRASIITLGSPNGLDRQSLELAINDLVRSNLMISGASKNFNWKDNGDGRLRWRELELPMLGWSLCYGLKGQELILSNSKELLQTILINQKEKRDVATNLSSPVDDLTVIRLDQRKQAFDEVFQKIDAPRIEAYWKARQGDKPTNVIGASQEFFSGNVASLLDAVSDAKRVEIRRSIRPGRLREEVEISF